MPYAVSVISLSSSRWSDDAGNETTHLHVFEIGEDGLIAYEGRFDEDDFASAYRELDRRYYAGEGAAFAEAGSVATDYAVAMFNGDYDQLFGDLSHPDMRVENRTRSGLPDRSLAELRAQHRGSGRHGRLGPDVALGRGMGVADVLHRPP